MSGLKAWFNEVTINRKKMAIALAINTAAVGLTAFTAGAYNENQNHTLKNIAQSVSGAANDLKKDIIGVPYKPLTDEKAAPIIGQAKPVGWRVQLSAGHDSAAAIEAARKFQNAVVCENQSAKFPYKVITRTEHPSEKDAKEIAQTINDNGGSATAVNPQCRMLVMV